MEDTLYDKLFNTLLTLRDARDHFKCYSATDLKRLIASKKKKAMQHLYTLEAEIADLRKAFSEYSPHIPPPALSHEPDTQDPR